MSTQVRFRSNLTRRLQCIHDLPDAAAVARLLGFENEREWHPYGNGEKEPSAELISEVVAVSRLGFSEVLVNVNVEDPVVEDCPAA